MGMATRLVIDETINKEVEEIELCSPYGIIVRLKNGEIWKFARMDLFIPKGEK